MEAAERVNEFEKLRLFRYEEGSKRKELVLSNKKREAKFLQREEKGLANFRDLSRETGITNTLVNINKNILINIFLLIANLKNNAGKL